MPIHESSIEAYLVERVKALGGEVRKVKWIGRRGAPDRCVWLPPRSFHQHGRAMRVTYCVWVELKAPGKKAEPHQVREHERMRAMGQPVAVVDSFNAVDALFSNGWDQE